MGIAAGVAALLVTLSAFFYLGITSILLWKLAVEGPEVRRVLAVPLLPVLFQNVGIPLAILGFSVRMSELAVIGALMIALGALITSDRSVALHPTIEAPLLGLAMVALASVGLFYVLA